MSEALFRMVRERFSSAPEVEQYQRRVSEGLRAWERTVAERYLTPPGRLLDIGCGGGREAIALHDSGHEVTGVDISAEEIESARATTAALGKDIAFRLGDGVTLDFPDASFEYAVIWGQALGNVPGYTNRVRLLRECARVLVPGGRLSFSAHNRDTVEPVARERGLIRDGGAIPLEDGDFIMGGDAASGSDTVCFWHYFRQDEIERLCRDAGFAVLECSLADRLGQTGWDTVWVCVGEIGD